MGQTEEKESTGATDVSESVLKGLLGATQKPMTNREAAKLAKRMGAWFEQGAWRFPSVATADEFRRRVGL